MATIPASYLSNGDVYANDMDRTRWTLASGDAGQPSNTPTFSDRTVQFGGTFGGATVTLEGRTADDQSWETLTDPQGNDISKTSPDMEAVSENPWSIRPKVTGGDGTTAIICTLVSRRSMK